MSETKISVPVFDVKTQMPEDGRIVIIDGGIGFFACGMWYSAVAHPVLRSDDHMIQWEVKWWSPMLHGSERPKANQ